MLRQNNFRMCKTFVRSLLLSGFGLILSALPAWATATFTLNLQLTNPGPDAAKVIGKFTLPDCLEPQNLADGQTWDSISRILRAPIGSLSAGETATIPIEVQVTTPECNGTATVEGEYTYSATGPVGATTNPPANTTELPSAISGGAGGGGLIAALVDKLRNSPQVVRAVNAAISPAAVVVSILSTIVVLTNVLGAGSHLIFSWLDYMRFLFFGFLRKRSKVPWGRVYNEWTKSPIAGAKVSVVETTFKKIKETQLTDRDGRFGFLVSPGNYYLDISRASFETKQTPPFNVGENAADLNLGIGLVEVRRPPVSFRLIVKIFQALNEFLYNVNPYVLAVGTAASAFALLVIPSPLNLAALIAYGVLDVLKVIFSSFSAKSYGVVIDGQTRQPLALSVVRLFNADSNWLMGTRVTDEKGRFTFLVLPGRYYITCIKGNYSDLKTNPLEVNKANVFSQTLELSTLPTAPPAV